MELLDRYLQAVRKHLPSRRQDDIIAELRANMESQLEDKEAALGRPLTLGETEDWLRSLGAPFLVASRYQTQQYLIGPTFFPIYLYVLRTAFLWSMIIYGVVSAVLVVFQTPNTAGVIEAVLRAPGILINVATWVTLVFAAIEFVTTHHPEKCPPIAGLTAHWHPGSLPPLEKTAAGCGKPRSHAQAVAEIVFGFLFLIWLLLVPRHPFLIMGPGAFYLEAGPFHLAPVWWTCFWCFVGLNVLQLGWRCVDLIRGTYQRHTLTQQIVFKLVGLVPLIVLLTVRDQIYVTLKNPAADQLRYGATLDTINKGIYLGAWVVCAIVVLQLAFDLGKWVWEASRNRVAAG